MPKSPDPGVKAVLEAWSAFEAGFKRSKKGNLWRNYEGLTVVVFRREGDGYYSWSISGDEVRFSPKGYDSEEEALGALGSELGVGFGL